MSRAPDLRGAFLTAAGELGLCAASWLFLRAARAHGAAELEAMREVIAPSFPVFDAVVEAFERGSDGPSVDARAVLSAIDGATRVLLVGVEADHLDALVAAAPACELALLTESALPADWSRVIANFGGRVRGVRLGDLHTFAGPRSVAMTFAYGVDHGTTYVVPEWLRAMGPDTRPHFRELLAWNVLPLPMRRYPRWLAEAPTATFTGVLP